MYSNFSSNVVFIYDCKRSIFVSFVERKQLQHSASEKVARMNLAQKNMFSIYHNIGLDTQYPLKKLSTYSDPASVSRQNPITCSLNTNTVVATHIPRITKHNNLIYMSSKEAIKLITKHPLTHIRLVRCAQHPHERTPSSHI